MDENRSTPNRVDEFVRLLGEHDRRLSLFILSLVPNWSDAEEIRQETNAKLWQEYGKFRSGSDFGAWARTIAWYEVLKYRERKHRNKQHASQAFLDLVAAKLATVVDQDDSRTIALAECVDELGSYQRELVRLYYTVGCTIKDIAHKLRSSPDAIYKALQRARVDLRECTDRKLNRGERA
jgi:RNA polymerase sigma-70 factor (ECF subfamily)